MANFNTPPRSRFSGGGATVAVGIAVGVTNGVAVGPGVAVGTGAAVEVGGTAVGSGSSFVHWDSTIVISTSVDTINNRRSDD